MARIQVLPLEMLTVIFIFVVRRHFDDKDDTKPPVLCLRAVCRLWRDIVNADPGLWKIVALHNATIAQEFMSRCGNRPLFVYLRGRSNALNSTAKPDALSLVLRERPQQICTHSLVGIPDTGILHERVMQSLNTGSFPGLRALEVLRTNLNLLEELFSGPVPPHLHILRFDLAGGGLYQMHRVLALCPLTILELRQIDPQALSLTTLVDAISRLAHLQELIIEVCGYREAMLAPRQAERSVSLTCLKKADFFADLPCLLLLLRPFIIPPAVKLSMSCLRRIDTWLATPADDVKDLKTLCSILLAHFGPLLPHDFHFTELTVEANHCSQTVVAGALILGGPRVSNSMEIPKRFVFKYRVRLSKEESVMDRSFATFPTLLSCIPACERVTRLFIKSPCVHDPLRFGDIFAAAPLIETIVVNDIYAKHLFWTLQSTFPVPMLPNLQKLVLHKIRLTERVAYNAVASSPDGSVFQPPPITVGDLLLLCLDYRRGHGSDNWCISLVDCRISQDHTEILRGRLATRFTWDGKGAST
ncbi:hypothetical protein PENSPDRAFT_759355 [Peniophora sp. CONT]|nr:hypothetical protein PENSPDRAFT_759355 [Peniophora sp. CONT]